MENELTVPETDKAAQIKTVLLDLTTRNGIHI